MSEAGAEKWHVELGAIVLSIKSGAVVQAGWKGRQGRDSQKNPNQVVLQV